MLSAWGRGWGWGWGWGCSWFCCSLFANAVSFGGSFCDTHTTSTSTSTSISTVPPAHDPLQYQMLEKLQPPEVPPPHVSGSPKSVLKELESIQKGFEETRPQWNVHLLEEEEPPYRQHGTPALSRWGEDRTPQPPPSHESHFGPGPSTTGCSVATTTTTTTTTRPASQHRTTKPHTPSEEVVETTTTVPPHHHHHYAAVVVDETTVLHHHHHPRHEASWRASFQAASMDEAITQQLQQKWVANERAKAERDGDTTTRKPTLIQMPHCKVDAMRLPSQTSVGGGVGMAQIPPFASLPKAAAAALTATDSSHSDPSSSARSEVPVMHTKEQRPSVLALGPGYSGYKMNPRMARQSMVNKRKPSFMPGVASTSDGLAKLGIS
jgi:hypothetical protein